MSERREPSREQKPFESRRTTRVTLVTRRNTAPVVPPSPAPAETDEGQPADRDGRRD